MNRLSIRMPGERSAQPALPRPASLPLMPELDGEPLHIRLGEWLPDIDVDDAMPYASTALPPRPMHTPDATVSQPYGWVSEWLVEEGEHVEPGQPIVEITDFHGVSTIVRSGYNGHILCILMPKDSLCYVGQQLYIIIVQGDVFSNRGGPRLKFLTPAFRHEAMAWWAQTYKLRL